MDYTTVKWLHIMSSTFLFGTGVGSAFYLLLTAFTRDVRAIAIVSRQVVLADWLFTTTTAIIQPLTGFWLVHLAGFPLSSLWLSWSIILYVLSIACWLPVVWLQMRIRNVARDADEAKGALPEVFWRYFWIWVTLGIPAFFSFVTVFYLMVAKPM